MTPRSTATLFALSGLTALYMRAYKTAAGCALLASYVALSSIKELPKKRATRGFVRSQSAPNLSELPIASPIRPIDLRLIDQKLPALTLLPSQEVRRSAGHTLVKAGELPRANRTIWNWTHRLIELRSPATLVGGVVDTRYMPPGSSLSLDLEELFGTSLISLERGQIAGAAHRLGLREGGWVVCTDCDADAYQFHAQCSAELRKRVLIVLGGRLNFIDRSLNRIDLRFMGHYQTEEALSKLHRFVRDGGEIRLITGRQVAFILVDAANRVRAALERVVLFPPREEVEGDAFSLIFTTQTGRKE